MSEAKQWTDGPWEPAIIPDNLDPAETIARMLKEWDSPVYFVCAPQHPRSNEQDGVTVVAITGNGPDSEYHARLIACVPDMLARIAQLEAANAQLQQQLAAGDEWEPFDIVDDDIMATDIKGRGIEPVKVLTTVVDGLLTMRMSDSDTPFLSWQLKDNVRLCQLVEADDAPGVTLTPEIAEALRVHLDAYPYRDKTFGGPAPDVEAAYKTLRAWLAQQGGNDDDTPAPPTQA